MKAKGCECTQQRHWAHLKRRDMMIVLRWFRCQCAGRNGYSGHIQPSHALIWPRYGVESGRLVLGVTIMTIKTSCAPPSDIYIYNVVPRKCHANKHIQTHTSAPATRLDLCPPFICSQWLYINNTLGLTATRRAQAGSHKHIHIYAAYLYIPWPENEPHSSVGRWWTRRQFSQSFRMTGPTTTPTVLCWDRTLPPDAQQTRPSSPAYWTRRTGAVHRKAC